MEKIIIVYGSTTGTTEGMSQLIMREIRAHASGPSDKDLISVRTTGNKPETEIKFSGLDVTVRDVASLSPKELSDYGVIILGCSTWGDGELQEDFIDFEEELRGIDLKDKRYAVFGPGESVYSQFCKAVDILGETLKQCGAHEIIEGLKVDVMGGPFEDAVRAWAKSVIQALN
ncbi:MAG: flavodoxin domain-containing protein [Candidatus Omnitrophica bacterium]|nr:flavodoxin domain-containing protein [Candidatus Omnitrophota bacterium]